MAKIWKTSYWEVNEFTSNHIQLLKIFFFFFLTKFTEDKKEDEE